MTTRDTMAYDIVIVGAGPAGLSAAIRLKQLALEKGAELSVCVLEKGSEPGAHIISGAIMDARALDELLPQWKTMDAPPTVPVSADRFFFLSRNKAYPLPEWMLPQTLRNKGHYLVSLSRLVRWLAGQAEALGIDIFSGFAATEVLYSSEGAVTGVATGAVGIGKNGEKTSAWQPGVEIMASYTLFAEGSRGQLGRQLIERFALDRGRDPQSHSISLKEIWQVRPEVHQHGLVIHTAGWPLDNATYGGGFLYHMENYQVAIGLTVGLSYENPYLSPHGEFQRFKTHPAIRRFLEGGKCLEYGARSMTTGGLQAMPELVFPGGAFLGGNGGFLNGARLKGIHSAIQSGILAATAAFDAVGQQRRQDRLYAYPRLFQASWLYDELHRARNFKPWMSKGLWLGALMSGADQVVLGGKAPWTLHRGRADYASLKPASACRPLVYDKPDGILQFDMPSSLYLSGTHHEENQPSHLLLKDETVPVEINLKKYAGPEERYCPAAVYVFVKDAAGTDHLRIHASNCLHCKACDIKDPTQNIIWTAPEGGGGPNYQNM